MENVDKLKDDFIRLFIYSFDFYLQRMNLLVFFSIPALFAFMVPVFVPAPSYAALGGLFLRTGSIPDLSTADILLTFAGYAISMFLIAVTVVNINLIIRSKRTLTEIRKEMVDGISHYATKIFLLNTFQLLFFFGLQILFYENSLSALLFPLSIVVISATVFFVPPALVIDGYDLSGSIFRSFDFGRRKLHFIAVWALLALAVLSIVQIFANLIFPVPFSGYFVLGINSLFLLPFLLVLQTHIYLEKYPLAR